MIGVDFKITGDKELDKALARLEPAIEKKVLRGAVRDAAKVVHKAAKVRVPERSGELRRSLKVRAAKRSRKRKHQVRIGINAGKDYAPDTRLPYYAVMVEFGTVPRYTKAGGYRGKIEAKPFLRPALYESAGEVRMVFIDAVRKRLAAAVSAARGGR